MRAQDREAHFVRACPIDNYMDMQNEQICIEIYKKNAHGHFTSHILFGNLKEKMPHTLSGDGILYGNFTEKTRVDMSQDTRISSCGN